MASPQIAIPLPLFLDHRLPDLSDTIQELGSVTINTKLSSILIRTFFHAFSGKVSNIRGYPVTTVATAVNSLREALLKIPTEDVHKLRSIIMLLATQAKNLRPDLLLDITVPPESFVYQRDMKLKVGAELNRLPSSVHSVLLSTMADCFPRREARTDVSDLFAQYCCVCSLKLQEDLSVRLESNILNHAGQPHLVATIEVSFVFISDI